MEFDRQFDEFDPMIGDVPNQPFLRLPLIALRARILLNKRTRDEIMYAAQNIDWIIEEHSRQKKEAADTQEEGDHHYSWFRHPYPLPQNFSKLDLMREHIHWYVLEDDHEFQNGQAFEYFAVLALWLVADIIKLLNKKNEEANNLLLASNLALEAMDAACYAEYLGDTVAQDKEVEVLRLQLHNSAQQTEAIAEIKATQRISLAAFKAAKKRHEPRDKVRDLAKTLYLKNTWKSTLQASKFIFPQVQEYSREVGLNLTDERGRQTVYEWLLEIHKQEIT